MSDRLRIKSDQLPSALPGAEYRLVSASEGADGMGVAAKCAEQSGR